MKPQLFEFVSGQVLKLSSSQRLTVDPTERDTISTLTTLE